MAKPTVNKPVVKHNPTPDRNPSDEEEVKIDFKKVKGFFTNKKIFNNYVLLILLVAVGVFLSAYFRSYPAGLPVTDEWARNAAYNSIRNNIAAQVNQQYPNLPDANKNQLINQQLETIFKEQEEQIEQQIKATSDYFRSRLQTDEGQTYLLAIDPYQHLRRAENILKNGHVGDILKDGKPYNIKQFAPVGKPAGTGLHPYFIFYFYKFLRLFNPGISMFAAAFWVPVLISALSVIPAFFIVRRRAGLFGGFIAGMIVAIHPVFLGRTAAGFSDTDAYVVFFALLITWLFIEGFETKNVRNKIILTVLAGFFVGVFSFAWSGWWYVFDLLVGLLLIYLGYVIFKLMLNKISFKKILSNQNLRGAVIVLVVFLVCSALFVPLLTGGRKDIKIAFTGPITKTKIKDAAHPDHWPNIQTTVAELNPISIPGAIRQIGGKLLFFIGALGLILSLVKMDELKKRDYAYVGISFLFLMILLSNSLLRLKPITYLILLAVPVIIGFVLLLKDDREVDIKYAILLTLWFIGSMYASTKGTRFVLLLVPAFGIAMGISLGLIHKGLTRVINQEFKIKKIFVSLALIVLLCLFLINPIKAADSTARQEVPSMNDAWWESLTKIKLNSSEDAIINSWWDFGHWFKYVADRAVTVDGAGQDYFLAHWMGTVLITDDEEKAVNTLRMLDCGSRETYFTLRDDLNDILLAVNLTKTIIMQDEEEARQTLEDAGVSQEAIETTLGYAFCDPPENFLITSEDMVGKAGVWGHFGSWNFRRAFIYNNAKNKKAEKAIPALMEEFDLTEDEATDYYYQVQALSSESEGNAWIAPWPNYFTGKWGGCKIINADAEEDNLDNTINNNTNTSLARPDLMMCNINKGVRQDNNQNLVIESARLDLDNYKNSSLIIGSYDPSSGYRIGGGAATPSSFVLFKEDGIERVKMENVTFPYDVLIDMVKNKALVTDPLLSESLFTHLFYLDGRYTTRFEKFSDVNTVNGQRVSVWKVKWD
ncbi:hypothetical protein KY348_04090 [Candidatus Woesearchaeota archaeon]|nr:hypothetical protein [Candidatus Woesearchaeota archaeon]